MNVKSTLTIIAFILTLLSSLQTTNAQTSWNLAGNTNATTSSKLGTTKAIPLRLTTNNQTRIYISANNGNVGIGTGDSSKLSYRLQVTGNAFGIYGTGTTYGLSGFSTDGKGVFGQSSNGYGVHGSSNYLGILGEGGSYGVYGFSQEGYGIDGNSTDSYAGRFISTNSYGMRASTTNGAYAGVFDGNVYTFGNYFTSSDKNLKKNIQDLGNAMSIINKLKPKNYEFRTDDKFGSLNLPKGTHYGLIAQEVEEVLPDLVKESPMEIGAKTDEAIKPGLNDGKAPGKEQKVIKDEPARKEIMNIKGVNYEELIPILIKGLQEQDAKIQEQDAKIKKQDVERDEQDAKIEALTQLVNKLQRSASGLGSQSNVAVNAASLSSASLDQNIPNPLTNSTSIHYTIPSGSSKAELVITDNNGNPVKQVSLNSGGKGLVNIETSTLSAGTYSYTLIVDGKKIDTKKMVIVR